jgi:hypothetical protein
MPKKSTKLSELLLDMDKDQLCDILLNLSETSAEIENRVRTLITPKNQLDNTISYYRKLLKKIPSKIKNVSDRKLLIESLNPLFNQIKDLQSIKNYSEANKPLFVILEVMLFKLSKSELKSMINEMQKSVIAWCDNLDKINNSEQQYISLHEVLNLENAKELKLEPRILGYMLNGGDFTPTYSSTNLHVDFYELLLQLSKSINSTTLLEDLKDFLTKHSQSKSFALPLLNISQKIDNEDVFIQKVTNNLQNRNSAILLKNYYWQKGEFKKGVDVLYQHINLNQNYFSYKSSEEYLSAQEYIEIYDSTPEYCNEIDYCQVLVNLITTGECNTTQDVGVNAKWRTYLYKLTESNPKNFEQYYSKITDILSKKYLSKILAEIALMKRDKNLLSKYLAYIEDWDGMMESCLIIASDYSEIALKKIANISRTYLSEYDYFHIESFKSVITKDRFLAVLKMIRININQEFHKQIDNLIKKVHTCYR